MNTEKSQETPGEKQNKKFTPHFLQYEKHPSKEYFSKKYKFYKLKIALGFLLFLLIFLFTSAGLFLFLRNIYLLKVASAFLGLENSYSFSMGLGIIFGIVISWLSYCGYIFLTRNYSESDEAVNFLIDFYRLENRIRRDYEDEKLEDYLGELMYIKSVRDRKYDKFYEAIISPPDHKTQ